MSGFCSEMGNHWEALGRRVSLFDRSFYRISLPSGWIIELGGKRRKRGMTGPWTSVMAMKKVRSNCPEIFLK